ncbi:hypothetical protein FHR20_000359 [Sphingomonas leidyi]|uniref:Uncharacterized protein n=1 Tax=Sphingomonas leidyi TaxID=68569 RepID=A0A7X5UWH1_9SPHN|nr:hypothetical protein [Sphingomonas leidyi]
MVNSSNNSNGCNWGVCCPTAFGSIVAWPSDREWVESCHLTIFER